MNDYPEDGFSGEEFLAPRQQDEVLALDDSVFAGIAYGVVSAHLRLPQERWRDVDFRAADELWQRLKRRAATTELSKEDARAYAEQQYGFAKAEAYRDIVRGGDRRPPPVVFRDDLRIPFVTEPQSPEDLAIASELAEELHRITRSAGKSVQEIAEYLKYGYSYREIDVIRGKKLGTSNTTFRRARASLAHKIKRYLGDDEK